MLAPAAVEAVKQWRYRPYLLNNEPIEVETDIRVNFLLAGGIQKLMSQSSHWQLTARRGGLVIIG
jgi:hypothetical protein